MKPVNYDSKNLEQLLDEVLAEDIEAAREREQTTFDARVKSLSQSLVLFGAGGLGKKTLAGLRSVGIEPLGFTDNNPNLWGKTVDGLRVYAPKAAADLWKESAAFIVTIWRHGAKERMVAHIDQLCQLGCQVVEPFIFLFWKYPEIFLPYYMIDLPSRLLIQKDAIRSAFALYQNEASRNEFYAQIKFRCLGNFSELPAPVGHETFFPTDLWRDTFSDTFIDCGAFIGDTLQPFLKLFEGNCSKVIVIEPDPNNFFQLETYIQKLPASQKEKIIPKKLAIGSRNEKVNFNAEGNASSSTGQGDLLVDCVCLDDLLAGIHPSMIKMDIEGAEPDALIGASKTIANYLPMLAISVYHCQDHLWQIPLLIKSISNHYQLYLRPHQLEGWDLICYAITE